MLESLFGSSIPRIGIVSNDEGLQQSLYATLIQPMKKAERGLKTQYSEKENEIKNILNIP